MRGIVEHCTDAVRYWAAILQVDEAVVIESYLRTTTDPILVPVITTVTREPAPSPSQPRQREPPCAFPLSGQKRKTRNQLFDDSQREYCDTFSSARGQLAFSSSTRGGSATHASPPLCPLAKRKRDLIDTI
jgi:hypothetical protein